MSLELNSDNDYVVLNGAANLGAATSGSAVGLYFKNDASSSDIAFYFAKSGSAAMFRTVSATEMCLGHRRVRRFIDVGVVEARAVTGVR